MDSNQIYVQVYNKTEELAVHQICEAFDLTLDPTDEGGHLSYVIDVKQPPTPLQQQGLTVLAQRSSNPNCHVVFC